MTNLLIVNSTQSHEKPSAELGYTQLDVKRTHERLLDMNLEKLDYWIGCQLDDIDEAIKEAHSEYRADFFRMTK